MPPRRGMLGAIGPDEFPEFNGWKPPASRSQVVSFTVDDAHVVLHGDGSGHGEHAFGMPNRKDKFPEGWTERDVVEFVRAIFDRPSDGRTGRSADRFSLFGWGGPLTGVVRLRRAGRLWLISATHPYDRIRWQREVSD